MFFIFSILFTLLSHLLHIASAAPPLFFQCPPATNFSTKDTYHTHLTTLLGRLLYRTPPSGFTQLSIGTHGHNQVNGLTLCRGDISPKNCTLCLSDALRHVRSGCLVGRRSSIWYDHCFLRYSDEYFFGKIDGGIRYFMWNTQNVSNPSVFENKTKELLNSLAKKAPLLPRMYSVGELRISRSGRIYGLVQCTRDLSKYNCRKCLNDMISSLPKCCSGKQGGRVVSASCNVRYEIYPFFHK